MCDFSIHEPGRHPGGLEPNANDGRFRGIMINRPSTGYISVGRHHFVWPTL